MPDTPDEMVDVTFTRTKVYHDGVSMIVRNPGDDLGPIEASRVRTFMDEGVIEPVDGFTDPLPTPGGAPVQTQDGGVVTLPAIDGLTPVDDAEDDEGDALDDPDETGHGFEMKHLGGGTYLITGPGLADEGEKVKGKDDAQKRFDALVAEAGADDDAPTS